MSRWVYWVSLTAIVIVIGVPMAKIAVDPLGGVRDLFKLGIDLQGGTSLVYQLKAPEGGEAPSASQAKRVISGRIDPQGTRGYVVRPVGEDRLEIVLPGRRTRLTFEETRIVSAEEIQARAKAATYTAGELAHFQGKAALAVRMKPALLIDDIAKRIRQGLRAQAMEDARFHVVGIEGADDRYERIEVWTTAAPENASALQRWKDMLEDTLSTQRDVERVKRLVRQAGFLQFRIIAHREEDAKKANFDRLLALKKAGQPSDNPRFRWYPMADSWWKRYAETGLPAGWIYVIDAEARKIEVLVNVGDGQDITGDDLATVYPDSRAGEPIVGFTMQADAQDRLARLTSAENRGRSLGILLDGTVQSAPILRATLSSGGIIEGYDKVWERDEVITILNSGKLAASLGEPIFERTVGPELGEDNIQKGVKAIVIGLILVAAFMAAYYLFAGIVADLALGLNLVLIVCVMWWIAGGGTGQGGVAWTLPGIAGLILTIGMSVDANVLIFERIREEKGRGGSLALAIKKAYGRAFRTILDANITTLIPAFVLLLPQLSTEEVKGFAVVIVVGIGISMFTALVITRMIFETGLKLGLIRDLKMLQLVEAPKVNWMKFARAAVIVSGIVVLAGASLFYGRGRSKYDIEFTGGTQVALSLETPEGQEALDIETVRERVVEVLGPAAIVQRLDIDKSVGGEQLDSFLISVSSAGEAAAADEQKVKSSLRKAFDDLWPEAEGVSLTIEASEITEEVIRARLRGAAGTVAAEGEGEGETGTYAFYLPPEDRQFLGGLRVEATASAPISENEVRQSVDAFLRSEHADLAQTPLRVEGTARAPQEGRFTAFEIWIADDYEGRHAGIDNPEFWTGVLEGAVGEREFALTTSFEPTMAGETWHKAVLAIVFSLIAIVLYMWFRFAKVGYGIAAVVALVHDVFIVMGVVALTGLIAAAWPGNPLLITDMRINLPMVGAFLTLIGYSLNDTIVVFDRIRENRGKFGELSVEVTNTSINQTLTRTIWTSFTTLMVVTVLYFMGGTASTLHGFAFVLTLGVLVGTYSSIAIASPLLVIRTYLLRVYATAYPILGVLLVVYYMAREEFLTTPLGWVAAVGWLVWLGLAAWATWDYTHERPWPVKEKAHVLALVVAGIGLVAPLAFVGLCIAMLVAANNELLFAAAGPAAIASLFALPAAWVLYRTVFGSLFRKS